MSSTETLSLASRALEAFNNADWDAFRDLCNDDVVYVESGTGRRIEGIEAYLEALREWKIALPDVHGTIRRAVADDDLAAQDILWRGTHQGMLPTPTGPVARLGRRDRRHGIPLGDLARRPGGRDRAPPRRAQPARPRSARWTDAPRRRPRAPGAPAARRSVAGPATRPAARPTGHRRRGAGRRATTPPRARRGSSGPPRRRRAGSGR